MLQMFHSTIKQESSHLHQPADSKQAGSLCNLTSWGWASITLMLYSDCLQVVLQYFITSVIEHNHYRTLVLFFQTAWNYWKYVWKEAWHGYTKSSFTTKVNVIAQLQPKTKTKKKNTQKKKSLPKTHPNVSGTPDLHESWVHISLAV